MLLGVAVRSSALVLTLLTLAFTALVFRHALALYALGDVAFCDIRFDCGCGAGEVFICWKLLENTLLVLVGVFVTVVDTPLFALRYRLTRFD